MTDSNLTTAKFERPLCCFIAEPLRKLRDWSIVNADEISRDEPKHPHTNIHLAERLQQCGAQVFFSNRTDSRISEIISWLSAWKFDVVLAYSTMGAVLTRILKINPGHRPAVVLIILSFPNPEGPKWRVSLRCAFIDKAVTKADAVICGLKELAEIFVQRGLIDNVKVFYSPTGVDTDFYDPRLVRKYDSVEGLSGKSFILLVGDSSRDDEFIYTALKECPIPLVRVTRDISVINNVRGLMNERRGDCVLKWISFRQLRWLYVNCSVFITASRWNTWQAAGSTALTEAMACGAICICNGGGCIEREWRSLAVDANIDCPVRFYRPFDAHSLRNALEQISTLTDKSRIELSLSAREMALRVFPVERSYSAIVEAVACVSKKHAGTK